VLCFRRVDAFPFPIGILAQASGRVPASAHSLCCGAAELMFSPLLALAAIEPCRLQQSAYLFNLFPLAQKRASEGEKKICARRPVGWTVDSPLRPSDC